MKRYFIFYYFIKNGKTGYANGEVELKSELDSWEKIKEIEKTILKENNLDEIIIFNWNELKF